MKVTPRLRRDDTHLVTQARRSRSDDIAFRERRYLIMMAFRVVCFGLAIVLFTQGAGWFAIIPAAGAIVLPYIAVVFANGGREPAKTQGFREYQPNLPVPSSQPPTGHTVPPGHPEQDTGNAPTGGNRPTASPTAGSPAPGDHQNG